MRICALTSCKPDSRLAGYCNKKRSVKSSGYQNLNNSNHTSFKGDTGAFIGMASGILVGAGIAAAAVATGGLAAVVAVVGIPGAIAGGTTAGDYIEETLDKKK